MNRRFICTQEDLSRFELNMMKNYTDHFISYGVHGTSIREYFEFCLSYKMDEVEFFYGHRVSPDETTWEAITAALSTLSFIDLHYALHHIIWQVLEDDSKGLITLNEPARAKYKKITEDCTIAP